MEEKIEDREQKADDIALSEIQVRPFTGTIECPECGEVHLFSKLQLTRIVHCECGKRICVRVSD